MSLRDRPREVQLVGVMIFMVITRMRSAGNYVTDSGVAFLGNDAWYHWRAASWTAANWPATINFDPWTGFPSGSHVGQFGTPYDLLLGTVASVFGGGDHSMLAAAAVPPVLAALTAVPVYLIARTLFDEDAAIVAVVALAAMPGVFFTRGLFGFIDHHVAETLLQTCILATLLMAVRAGPNRALPLSLTSGLFAALYVMVWPPGVYLFPVLAAGMGAAALLAYRRGDTGGVFDALLPAGPLMAPTMLIAALTADLSAFSSTSLTLLQLAAPTASLAAVVLLDLWLNAWSGSRVLGVAIPPAAAAALSAGFLRLTEAGSAVWEPLRHQFLFGTGSSYAIAEAAGAGPASATVHLVTEYGMLAVAAAFALGILVRRSEGRPDRVILCAWTGATLLMALTQVRYNYYLAAPVAVLSGGSLLMLAAWFEDVVEVDRGPAFRVSAALLLVLMAAAPATGAVTSERSPDDSVEWEGALEWLQEETPEPALEYNGEYAGADDFEYAGGAYGVMSWWDYGHWITTRAERIPVSNPFQQNAAEAADYFTASSEDAAEDAIDSLGPGSDERVRYVVVDDRMATDKLWAMSQFASGPTPDYFEDNERAPAYYDTMVAGLYTGDASGMERHRLVYESGEESVVAGVARDGEPIAKPRPMSDGELESVESDPSLSLSSVEKRSKIKIFERVDGAVVTGEADGSEVALELTLRTSDGRLFDYVQTAEVRDGRFEARVPYWSESDDERVSATGPYAVSVDGEAAGSVSVSEEAVRSGREVQT